MIINLIAQDAVNSSHGDKNILYDEFESMVDIIPETIILNMLLNTIDTKLN